MNERGDRLTPPKMIVIGASAGGVETLNIEMTLRKEEVLGQRFFSLEATNRRGNKISLQGTTRPLYNQANEIAGVILIMEEDGRAAGA